MGEAVRIVIVAGLGRCGSSLMMQMLQAGGMKCAGEFPAFELPETNHQAIRTEWLEQFQGGAVKILDPHYCPVVPDFPPAVMLWMTRDFYHQAKSQMKFALMLSGHEPRYDKHHLKRMEKSLERETVEALHAYSALPSMFVSFEGLLNNPLVMASKVAAFLKPFEFEIAPAKMAYAVNPRGPECADGLDMEMKLISERP